MSGKNQGESAEASFSLVILVFCETSNNMNKSNHFTGQPIFSQIISLIPKGQLRGLTRIHQSDRYYKKFKTYEHLVTMLYAVMSKCTSIREVTTGLMACDRKLNHLGMTYYPRKSTLSDANGRRDASVFEALYGILYKKYGKYLPDSRKESWASKLYIFDATTISLFQEILKNAGRNPMNGRRKGGIKAHTLMKANEDVPCLVQFTAAAAHDAPFMKKISLPQGSIAVFDKAYHDYSQYKKWGEQGISFVTRLRNSASYQVLSQRKVSDKQSRCGVLNDQNILLGHHSHNNVTRLQVRLVTYQDSESHKQFQFLTNNTRFSATTVAAIYKRRWQIETLFKRIKQNYPLRYFLGDNQNAIKIQIWCALIVDLLLKYIRKQVNRKWAFANLTSMIRLHLMTYINLMQFLNNPEKAIHANRDNHPTYLYSLFPT